MGAARKIRNILDNRHITRAELARRAGKSEQTLWNLLTRDSMSYSTVESLLDVLGFDIVFRDRETGEIFDGREED